MAIEIKELVVKFTVDQKNDQHTKHISSSISHELEKKLIERCTEEVLNKINRYEER